MNISRRRIQAGEDGFVLILVLLVTGALAALILDLNYTTRVNLHLAENFRDETRAFFLSRGAVEAAKTLLLKDGDFNYDDPESKDDIIWSTPNRHEEEGGKISIELTIHPEDGKIWINDTKRIFRDPQPPNGTLPPLLTNLREILDLPDNEIFDSIQDWIDRDDQVFEGDGAENDYYQSLDPPYSIRNGKLSDLSELLLVKGVDDALYFGGGPEQAKGLKDLFTLYSNGIINVNAAPHAVLAALMDETEALDIEENRPIREKQEIPGYSTLPPMYET